MKTKIAIFLLRLFSSCRPLLEISGKIVSDKTENPVEGATVELIEISSNSRLISSKSVGASRFLSDKNGNFIMSSRMMKIKIDLSNYQIRITKTGYQILQIAVGLNEKNRLNLFKLIEI